MRVERLQEITEISIHTPARGVTGEQLSGQIGIEISIHTPARGVTAGTDYCDYQEGLFQSTLPQGE